MATIVLVNTSNQNGSRVLNALQQIRSGISVLRELDGLRAESIGAGQGTMVTNFGASSNEHAQILSDRWSTFLTEYDTPETDFDILRDLLNAVTAAP